MGESRSGCLADLQARRFRLWRELVNLGDFVRGSVVLLHRPCIRDRCAACASGERHPATYLSVSHKGRTRLLYLPARIQATARQWVDNYRQLTDLMERVSEVNREILRRLGQEDGGGRRGRT